MFEPRTINRANLAMGIAALRSGEFQQGFTRLTTVSGSRGDIDCCLGVLCKVAIANGLELNVDRQDGQIWVSYDGNSGTLPYKVQEWYGFDSDNPTLNVHDNREYEGEYFTSATVANDQHRFTFREIADAFERTYLTSDTRTEDEDGSRSEGQASDLTE